MEKEQRRKKIIARGTDRMALITGRINTLEPDPISKCSSFSVNRPDQPPPQHARSTSEPLSANDQAFFQYVTKQDEVDEASKRKNSRNKVPKQTQPSPKNFIINLLGPFPAQAINFSLLSSEEIRAICSVSLGLVVVLSRLIFHHDSLVSFRPLYVLLLTDFIIFAARVVPYARARKVEEHKYEDDDDNLEGAVKLLELGMVLHQMSSAFFIDCCFYMVVVILGLSLV